MAVTELLWSLYTKSPRFIGGAIIRKTCLTPSSMATAVWVVLASIGVAQAKPAPIVFAHVSVVPMDGDRVLSDQDVTIRGNAIASIEPAASAKIARDAKIIDGTGKFLMPGLGEMHAHLPSPADPPGYMETALALYVANGVTTVRGMLGYSNHLVVRKQIESGKLWGPSLFLAGPGLSGDTVKSPEDGVRQVREQKAQGWDMVKILPGLTRAEYDAIMTEARRLGIRTGGHVPKDVGIDHVLESGQETIEHLDGYEDAFGFGKYMPDDFLKAMALKTREAGAWTCPTLAIMRFVLALDHLNDLLARPEMEYIPQVQVDEWMKLYDRGVGKGVAAPEVERVIQQNRERLLKTLNDVGAPILLGDDTPNLFQVPGYSIHNELGAMQAAGLSPYDVLASGTKRVGEYLHKPVGTVTVGYIADLLLLDADPLKDVANVKKLSGVMMRGQWYPGPELQRRLKVIHDRPGNYR
jgi:imidazolonepropionase-like amidohydrolase